MRDIGEDRQPHLGEGFLDVEIAGDREDDVAEGLAGRVLGRRRAAAALAAIFGADDEADRAARQLEARDIAGDEAGDDILGQFRGRDAVRTSVTRKQLHGLLAHGVIDRVHPDTYRMTAVPPSNEQLLRAALLWAGDAAAAAGRSAGEVYGLEGVIAKVPEIAVPPSARARSSSVIVHTPSATCVVSLDMTALSAA